jgi:hypothetical protein
MPKSLLFRIVAFRPPSAQALPRPPKVAPRRAAAGDFVFENEKMVVP